MAAALVGTIGAENDTAVNTINSPAWGTGESRTANNLGLLWVVGSNGSTLPGTPSGWSVALSKANTNTSATLLYKVLAGSDAAPSIGAASGVKWSCMLGEFSGLAATTPLDQTGFNSSGTGGSNVATCGSTDTAAGELLVACSSAHWTATGSRTTTDALTTVSATNDLSSFLSGDTANHYGFAWGVTTSNAAASTNTWTYPTTNISHAVTVVASFLVIPSANKGSMFFGLRGG